jgi:hypothetical protein
MLEAMGLILPLRYHQLPEYFLMNIAEEIRPLIETEICYAQDRTQSLRLKGILKLNNLDKLLPAEVLHSIGGSIFQVFPSIAYIQACNSFYIRPQS